MITRTPLEPFTAHPDWRQRAWDAPRATTLVDLLSVADLVPDLSAFVFVDHGAGVEPLTWSRLRTAATGRAHQLAAAGVAAGDRVVVMLPTGPGFFEAFFGALLLGATPVPVAPPYSVRRDKLAVAFSAITRIADDCGARALVGMDGPLKALADFLRERGGHLHLVSIDEPATGTLRVMPRIDPAAPALVQYTSGSTSDPRGVVLTHAHVIANARAISDAIADRTTAAVCWLPLHHDMGLIGGALSALYCRCPQVLMPPQAFVRHPARWLQYLSDVRATTALAPNFAYALCTKTVSLDDMEGVDLSALSVALNGAEPVDPETIHAFEARFAPFGLRPGTLRPVYGLAECALAVTFGEPGPARTDTVRADALEEHGRAHPASGARRTRSFVSVGTPLGGYQVRIVDDADRAQPERTVGEVSVRGPSVMSGYYGRPEESAAALKNGWLHTGDLGYIADGRLYLTGRSKDLIIRMGRNYYAQDLERAIAPLAGLIPGGVAAFGVDHPDGPRIVVVAETRKRDGDALAELTMQIRETCHHHFDTGPDDIRLVAPGVIPRTTSGKVRRQACREAYEMGPLVGGG